MRLVEVFKSLEGEGARAGNPCIFIRLAGCNLRCSYCDTSYAQLETQGDEKTVEEVVDLVKKVADGCSKVTVTGGEPLLHKDIDVLLNALADDFDINVETNGSVDLLPIICNMQQALLTGRFMFTCDYKLPSSGVESSMLVSNLSVLGPQDVLKFVVGTPEDMKRTREVLTDYPTLAQVYISPVFGTDLEKLAAWVIGTPVLQTAKLQVQLHKIIWSPDQRGV